jgi:NitT/TauT family transport system permease protein
MAKAVMAAIVCYFPIVSNMLAAFAAVDRDWVKLFDFHRARFGTRLTVLLLPASFPALLSALQIAGGLAVVGAIVAEFTGADRGLGYLLLNATYRIEMDRLFVAIFLSAALGVLFASLPSLVRLVRKGRACV